jgi:hypothetical protein
MNTGWLRTVSGIATIAFPVLLLVGFALHPNLFSPHMTRTADDLVAKFHGKAVFHAGHLLVFLAVPLIILSFVYTEKALRGPGRLLGALGAVIGIFGAVVLAGDKGALCIVLSAFDRLPAADFAAIRPALQAIVERRGLLQIFWALPLLPVGAIIQMAGMIKEGLVSRASGVIAIVGLVLLNNPDIDLISSAGALLMCIAYVPFGLRVIGLTA